MQIITGKTGTNHVAAEDDRALHAATIGSGNYVLNSGLKFEATIETSNNIVLAEGDLLINGTHARIRHGETETVIIENGTTGYNRIDLIVARYTKASGIEDVQLAVIKGEPTTGTATQPEYTEGDVLDGVELAEMPLYAVRLSGVNVESVKPLFTIVTGLDDVYRKDEVYNKDEVNSKLTGKSDTSHNHDSAYYKKAEVDSKVTAVKTSFNQSVSVVQCSNNSILPPYGGTIGDYTITATVPANTKTVIPVLRSLNSTVYQFHGISASVSGTTATVTLKLSCTSTSAVNATAIVDLFCFKTV